ncbi:MAG TPA: OB-fold domain-containing protein [Ilumatobacteraceae bacterium]|nr:OB-fold domain-containing protein [Ilumatobacteraceae bacterium]
MNLTPRSVAPDDLDEPFWRGCRNRQFLIQRCGECQRAYWPASSCIDHGSAAMAWEPASGRATVHTYTIVHHAYIPELAERVPYVLAVVKLEEGPFFHTNIVGCSVDQVAVDQPVEVIFEQVRDDVVLPMFIPVTAQRDA